MESALSNRTELENLVGALYKISSENSLEGYEIFMFTDNSTAKAAFWKGTLTSPLLFELVLELKQLEMDSDLILHFIHISGKRRLLRGQMGFREQTTRRE